MGQPRDGEGRPILPSGDAPMNPGDQAPADAPSTGENLCRDCGGSGRLENGDSCPTCGGTGKVIEGVSAGS